MWIVAADQPTTFLAAAAGVKRIEQQSGMLLHASLMLLTEARDRRSTDRHCFAAAAAISMY